MAQPKKSAIKRPARRGRATPRREGESRPATESTEAETPSCFPIVALGASAGGLEALEAFFRAMPADSGMAFVVVTHQLPDHTSLLPELLRRFTAMPVLEVTTGIPIRANQLYLTSPGSCLSILNAVLQPMTPEVSTGPPLPIDYFFRALAEDQQERGIGIVLSGTGTDGTLGLLAIKGNGGITLVQAEDDARFSGMPHSARATGAVDHVLPAADMPQALLTFARAPYLSTAPGGDAQPGFSGEFLRQVYILLRSRTRHDFSAYKTTTIRRRIERRMTVHQLDTPQQYLQLLREQSHELDLLFRELLIGVTSFFRDPDAFNVLATQVLPALLQRRPEQHIIRAWVAGCSTGEEAYSLAILLRECMDQLGQYMPVQIFATDLDSQSIEKARAAIYPEGIARDVNPERLERFFKRLDGHYHVKTEIREMVVFAEQNVIADPPFTKLDLLSCRNLLIYLESTLQHRLLPMFHYALNSQGILFLGSSESISSFTDLFAPLDKRWKLFQRLDVRTGNRLPADFATRPPGDILSVAARPTVAKSGGDHLERQVDKVLVQCFAPPSILVNEHGDIVFIHGLTGMFLQPAPGVPSFNLFNMAREGLRLELTTALRQAAVGQNEPVRRRAEVHTAGGAATVEVTVQVVHEPEPLQGLFLVTFQQVPADIPTAARSRSRSRTRNSHQEEIDILERELQQTKETLQSSLEESETITEELKSTNEELQSTNEELQSSNEELETAKEEMQSLNEELQTVNSELEQRVEDLSQTNDDMQNLLNSTDVATLFLDHQLYIKRFTPQASQVIKLIASDVGRPIGDLVSNLDYEHLAHDAQEVLRTLAYKEVEIPTSEGQWYHMRMMPYRTAANMIEGLVITFIDITKQKLAELAEQEAQMYANSIVEMVREALVVLDAELRVVSASRAFYQMFQNPPEQITGERFFNLSNGQWRSRELQPLLEGLLTSETALEAVRFTCTVPDVGEKVFLLNARRMERLSRLSPLILLTIDDCTDWPHAAC